MLLSAATSARFDFGWKPGIDRLIWVGPDLQVGAMMIAKVAHRISAMRRHKLDHLQRALRAIDIRNFDIGFPVVASGSGGSSLREFTASATRQKPGWKAISRMRR